MGKSDAGRSPAKKIADNTAKGAMSSVLEELFQDMYQHRWAIYKMNFVRGLMFALGGIIGGTVVLALLLWGLSLLDQIPFLGDLSESARRTIETGRKT